MEISNRVKKFWPRMSNLAALPSNDENRTLGSQVYSRLRDDIVSGALAPGQKLTLESIKERYAVGITPLREALYRLSSSMLVEAEDQRGFRVAPISQSHLAEIITLRQNIEELVLCDAFKHADKQWPTRIKAAYERLFSTEMYEADGKRITRAWEATHREFHAAILSAAKSPNLLHFQVMLWDHAARYRNIAGLGLLNEAVLNAEHATLVDAIANKDKEMACILLRRHILAAAKPIQAGLERHFEHEANRKKDID